MHVVVHVDGGARGNPGPAAAAAVVSTPDGDVLDSANELLGVATNNVAEYRGLLLGLARAKALGATEVDVVNDSELVARQLTGDYRVKKEQLKPLHQQALKALGGFRAWSIRSVPREPRNVHAIPTNAELKMARALDLFNASEHRRTVSGVARSLGAPIVAVRPSLTEGSVVTIVVAWELSWYRYEVDLANEAAGVRVTAQGAELSELEPEDQTPNAAADELGELHLAAQHA